MPPPVVIYRSIFRGRLLYAAPGWLLAETARYIVTATVPGAETRQLVGPREDVIRSIATGRERTELIAWRTNRVVWLTPFGAAHAIGHFWNDDSGAGRYRRHFTDSGRYRHYEHHARFSN